MTVTKASPQYRFLDAYRKKREAERHARRVRGAFVQRRDRPNKGARETRYVVLAPRT